MDQPQLEQFLPRLEETKTHPPPLILGPMEQSIREFDVIVGDTKGEKLQLIITEAMEDMDNAVEIACNRLLVKASRAH